MIKEGGQQYSEEYTKINPKQEVPALEIDGHLILQSLAIIEYLDETRPGGVRLLPADPVKRAQVRMISEIINSGIQPYQNANVLKRLGDEKKTEWLQFYLSKGMRAIEAALKETSGKYCVGDEVSMADLCLIPQVYSGKHISINRFVFNL